MRSPTDHIVFSQLHPFFAVCFIDIVGSTKIVAHLSDKESDSLYEHFLNPIAAIIESGDGKVLKILGDGLFCYFPKTENGALEDFEAAFETAQAILDAHTTISHQLQSINLPIVDYRVSLSYGPVSVVVNDDNLVEDLFGTTINTCAKMNRLAAPNSIVVGSALREKIRSSSKFTFTELSQFAVSDTLSYMTYKVAARA